MLCLVLTLLIARTVPAGTFEQDPPKTDAIPIAVMSINPNYPLHADLQPVIDAIGDARIVVLSTATEGDGAAHWARTRLATALLEQADFSVLGFEAGFYDCQAMNAQFAAGTDASLCPAVGLPPQLARSGYFEALHRFVWKSYFKPVPVEVCGFDYQFTGKRTDRQLPRDLLEYLGSIDPHPLTKDLRRKYLTVLERLTEAKENGDDAGLVRSWQETHELQRVLQDNRVDLIESTSSKRFQVWDKILADMIRYAEEHLAFEGEKPFPLNESSRQKHMGERLVWIVNELYPDRRIIVFAGTLTALSDPTAVQVEPSNALLEGFTSAGQAWRSSFGDDLYTIACTSKRGISGWIDGPGFPITDALVGSVEHQLAAAGDPFVFVSLRNNSDPWWQRPRQSTMLGLNRLLALHESAEPAQRVRAVWPDQVDALLFIDQMFPNHWQAKPPEDAVHTVNIE